MGHALVPADQATDYVIQTAMVPTAAPTVTGTQYLPNVTRTLGGQSGHTTPFYLQSSGATVATATWNRFSDGGLQTTQTINLPFDSTIYIDLRAVSGPNEDSQYSVIITAQTGSVNAIVHEQSGGGGEAVMIYEGYAQ